MKRSQSVKEILCVSFICLLFGFSTVLLEGEVRTLRTQTNACLVFVQSVFQEVVWNGMTKG